MENKSGIWRGLWVPSDGRSSSTDLNPSESSPSDFNPSESPSSDLDPASIASTSSHTFRNNGYDVFISFRGPDTRNTFVGHLYAHLKRKGIFVFKDDVSLQKGESIPAQLKQAIKDSRVSVVVFSKDYAASKWCLEEMAIIADCKQHSHQTVFPVFYDVDPSHVRYRNGPYEEAFASHRSMFKEDPNKVHQWEIAMEYLANSVGWPVRNRQEFEVIENLVQHIINELDHNFSGYPSDLIGIQPRVEELENILKLNSMNDDVRVLGIWGMSGIGKTTQTTILYDKISRKFDGSCFIQNVSEIYKRKNDGGRAIHKQILRQTFKEENLAMCDSVEISRKIKYRLHNIKVLIVLDNVDQIEQLKALSIDPKKLLKGSKVIITTTDKKILRLYRVDVIHEVSLLNDSDARELFYKSAFKREGQISGSMKLMIPNILKYAQHLPLAIVVIGSFLCDCNVEQWKDLLDKFESDPADGIMNTLQKCVDGLQLHEKEIFLHIACFFNGERKDYVERILDCCGLHPCNGIPRIIEKSLITLRDHEIHMHDMMQELGKKIVRGQCLDEPESQNRIWLYKDFYRIMAQQGTENVKAIVLNKREDIIECSVDGLSRMKNLRLLILYHKAFSGSLNFLSHKLRYLLWHDYPFDSLPSNFIAIDMVELNMPNSNLKHLWEDCKNFSNLKRVDLSNSKYLIKTPDFSGMPKLERLDLSGCTSLTQVHPSIGLLEKLAFLSLRNCSNLVDIYFGKESNLFSLKVIYLSGCTKLEIMPDLKSATYLEYLDIDGCSSLSLVDESIGSLSKLTFLSLRNCENLVSIPDTINIMTSLQTLDLCGCLKLTNLPLGQTFISSSRLKSLIFLDLSFCNILEVPDAIRMLRCLERLNLQGNNLVSLSCLSWLQRLAYLNLSYCHNLEALPELPVGIASSAGQYFKTVPGSRDHRSGLYIFDCPKVVHKFCSTDPETLYRYSLGWLVKLIEEPNHFRCGFDLVVPWDEWNPWIQRSPFRIGCPFNGSYARIANTFSEVEGWIGFVFSVLFEVKNYPVVSTSSHGSFSSASQHPIYLVFESEFTEEYFDMPLNLEVDKIHRSPHVWMIYVSRQHCHFVKSGALIHFKGHPRVEIIEWGVEAIFLEDVDKFKMMLQAQPLPPNSYASQDYIHFGIRGNYNPGPKIQLPYNWMVTDGEEAENINAKAKEKGLSYAGL
ncbi:hypothetical protein Fmac_019181 [Flemingia macrophylla]|uniref:TIR domain-containing protein n=1 Tax=Flemingia macrophylla TaxID=520843 RepID=A0ABD1M788_9FABA